MLINHFQLQKRIRFLRWKSNFANDQIIQNIPFNCHLVLFEIFKPLAPNYMLLQLQLLAILQIYNKSSDKEKEGGWKTRELFLHV